MSESVHIFAAALQPATNFFDRNVDPPIRVRLNPRRTLVCHLCGTRRWAANMRVAVYYDCTQFFCKNPCGGRKRRKRRAVP